MTTAHRVAINPLPWILGDMAFDLSGETLTSAMSALRPIGFDHLTVDVPDGWTAAEYRAFLAEHGFRPAPGYFSGDWSDATAHAELVERVKSHANVHAELGLDRAFIAHDLVPQRIKRPAVGSGTVPLPAIADGLGRAAEAARAEGVRYALHPHVGSPVETEPEVRAVLDATAGGALAFGPDTGHLAWAGADPAALIRDYADRVVAVHLKDVEPEARAAALTAGDDYRAATVGRHLWIEPGRGLVDFDAVFGALPADFDGWFVVEVDVPHAPTAAESSAISYAFLQRQPYLTGGVS